jgi:predicted glycosyltransferase
MAALDDVAESLPVIFPVHPRTRRNLDGSTRVLLTEPLPYRQFLSLEAKAAAVVTDSGGIQEETTVLRVPCFTLRHNTERPITIELGTNTLLGLEPDRLREVPSLLAEPKDGQIPPLWDGKAGERADRAPAGWSDGLKVWVDMTASAHVLVFRPLIQLLRERGDEVEITARDYAQTLQLLELHGLDATVVGRHGGRSRLGKARSLASRLRALRKWARPRGFDLALAHGSHELTMTARRLGIPSATTHDYEFATLQHQLGMRAATKVVVPDSIPPERLTRFGVEPPKLLRYPGLKEEYYLSDFEPDTAVPEQLGVDRDRVLVVLRPPPDVSLYHRHSNPLFPQTLGFVGNIDSVHAVVLPRTDEQREYVRELALPSVIVPDRAVDAQSLIALADVVVSAGGTMNREAAALGVPVYTTYGGRLGGVDEELIRQARLKPLTDPRALELQKREAGSGSRVRRDPAVLLELLLTARGHDA